MKDSVIKYIFKLFHYLIISLIFYSCAQVVAPAGGLKDVTPPRVVKYVPDSAAINFKTKNINIYFNEYIQLKDVNSQLIISPPVQKQPTVKVKNKILQVEFEEFLKDSTTYSMNFGNAISDYTESNALENFRYVFSTGPYIDSLSVSGKVENAFDHKAEKGILVMLYSNMDDSIPFKKIPDYFTKTKEDGSFKINNIRNGKYRAFALKDINANYIYDSPEESIGFRDSIIDLQKDTVITISLFKEKLKKQFLRKASAIEYGHILFVFNKPIENLEITALNFTAKKEWRMDEYNANRDTLNCWLIGAGSLDTLKLQVSDNNKILDTVEIKTISREQKSGAGRGKGAKFELSMKTNVGNGLFDLDKKIMIEFSHPINKFKEMSTELGTLDSTKKVYPYAGIDKLSSRKFLISYLSIDTVAGGNEKSQKTNFPAKAESLKENMNYHLLIPSQTFTDIFELSNDTLKVDFKTQELKYYGTLKLKLKIPGTDKQYVVQLLTEKGNLVREDNVSKAETINYEYLHPGKYLVKIIYDTNKNDKWDTGDYLKKQQPEKVIFYSGEVNIRSNWDLEQEWKVEQ